MTYPLVLQTISTLTGLVGVGTVVYVTFLAKRLHGAVSEVKASVTEQTTDLKQSIEAQTTALKKP